MSAKLSDDRLRGIIRALNARSTMWRDSADAILAIDELLELRAIGPVMPEKPSDKVIDEIAPYHITAIYGTIRAALAKEQGL